MSIVSTGKADHADVEESLNSIGLGEIIYRNVYFEEAGQDVVVPLSSPYVETDIEAKSYRAKVIQGDRRATIRKGSTAWTKDHAWFTSDTSDVYADIAVQF